MKRIKVNLDRKQQSSYEIYIGHDILDRIGLLIAKNRWASRYFIVADSNVATLYGKTVLDTFGRMELKVDMIDFPAGEKAKNISTCETIAERMAGLGADRTSAVIALGGGVTGDIAAFTASIYMRGIPCIQIPTSLLAQVDSSIGGKTGVDTMSGKNLMGTFCQPKAVFIDMAFLKTLPDVEFRNGLAEIVKYGIIESPELLKQMETDFEAINNRDPSVMGSVISSCCRIKKSIVEIDEKESGLRRILNFGHTIGHALEAESGYGIPHGEAVSIGIAAAAGVSERMRYLAHEDRERIMSVLRTMKLANRIPRGLDIAGIISRLKMDKKKQGDTIHFVLLKKVGIPFVNGGVPEATVRSALEDIKDD